MVDSLWWTLSGLEVPMITIGEGALPTAKDLVVITARVHPGETNSSWVLHGFLKFITGNSKKA